jgi:hypothetical protein
LYVVTGLWPIISGDTFQQVTGFKTDFWLAQTLGALLCVSGITLFSAARSGRVTFEVGMLGALQAAVLVVVDIICVQLPGTTWAYWIDAPVELGFVCARICSGMQCRERHASRPKRTERS